MITKLDLNQYQDDHERLKIALKEGCYYLACISDGLDPKEDHHISKDPEEKTDFDKDNPFVHLYRRYM